jgi:23S rRNA (uracil1939-C5)-methyltransferase
MTAHTPSPCEHSRCGGCALLHLGPGEQLARKRAHVTQAFAPYASLAGVAIGDVQGATPSFEYRTRAKLVVSREGAIGLYERGSHEVIDIPQCRVMAPALVAAVAHVRERLSQTHVPLTGVDVREVRWPQGHGVLLTLLGDSRNEAKLAVFARELAAAPGVLGVSVSLRATRAPQLLGDVPIHIAGQAVARDVLYDGAPYHYATFGAFVQAHRGQAQAIAERVQRSLTSALGTLERARVLELYAGSGALALALCTRGARPLLVERYEPALQLVARAAEEQGLRGLATRVGDAEQVLGDLVRERERFDAVIVDPPRRGLPPEVRRGIAALAPKILVYVSCDPTTLARDLAHLAALGYQPRDVAPLDMMPQSDDVECLTCLVPAAPTPLTVLHEDDDLIAVDKPPHLPTTPQGEHDDSLLARLRLQLSASSLHAVHRLDLGTSGICLFTRHAARVAGLAQALADGQKRYTTLTRGVVHAKGIIKTPLHDEGTLRDAVTRYTRKRVVGGHSLVNVRPEQGRMHQVRKHLASLNHPVLGDARYGDPKSNQHFEHKHGLDRTFLHLSHLELVQPGTGQPLVLDAPLPGDLVAVLASLETRHDSA